ncbi:hypothetical protein Patl1_32144 [Pistacia atlantica]|uniref:Uncharacterized protein n=1 Tax=Pistacia atlantica TaxID=434234 RepID=A0ACC1AQU9_9ROSI|nr:hypothetical protein Patl1_32144 [Pistacia atlantica]
MNNNREFWDNSDLTVYYDDHFLLDEFMETFGDSNGNGTGIVNEDYIPLGEEATQDYIPPHVFDFISGLEDEEGDQQHDLMSLIDEDGEFESRIGTFFHQRV